MELYKPKNLHDLCQKLLVVVFLLLSNESVASNGLTFCYTGKPFTMRLSFKDFVAFKKIFGAYTSFRL